jgi:hypothetical protein
VTRATGGQATVERYDAAGRAGAVLLDDGSRLPFAAAALQECAVRLLRPGQRVALEVADGEVVAVRPPWAVPPPVATGPDPAPDAPPDAPPGAAPSPAARAVDARVRARSRGTMGP